MSSGIEVFVTKSAEFILALIFVYSCLWNSYSDATGLPIQLNDKGLNSIFQPFTSKMASKAEQSPHNTGPFHHDSGELKADVMEFKVSNVALPENISIITVPGKGLAFTSPNISFKVDCEWQNGTIRENPIEDGFIQVEASEINVSVAVQVNSKQGQPFQLDITGCEASIGRFDLQLHCPLYSSLVGHHLKKDLSIAVCKEAVNVMNRQLSKLEKTIGLEHLFKGFILKEMHYGKTTLSGVLEPALWPGQVEKFPHEEMTDDAMFKAVITETFLNSGFTFLHASGKNFSFEVKVPKGTGLGWTDTVNMRIQFPNTPKAKISSKGINITTTGVLTFIPCQAAVDQEKWSSTEFNVITSLKVVLDPQNRSLNVEVEKISISSPHPDDVAQKVANGVISGYLKGRGKQVAVFKVPLPHGMAFDGLKIAYKEGLAVVSSDVVEQESE